MENNQKWNETAFNNKIKELALLAEEICENWNEDYIKYYPQSLPSFDELCADLSAINNK